jgi:hypothetical protein
MPMPEKTCVDCGKVFTLLPNKPGLVNVCPQCACPQAEIEVIERKPKQRRRKTANELVADAERKLRRTRKTIELIYGKDRKDDSNGL